MVAGVEIRIMADVCCSHPETRCVNEYELIRKYECLACGGVLMCACDEHRGTKFLSHQLQYGKELESQKPVPVTHGFQPKICRDCRGLPPTAAPVSATHGRTTKIRRYYWREITFRKFDILEQRGISDLDVLFTDENIAQEIEQEALEQIKRLHEREPKYQFETESEAAFLARIGVRIVDVRASARPGGLVELASGLYVSSEHFAAEWLSRDGYESMECESVPLHVLFSVLLSPLIEDSTDPLVRTVMFGDRTSFEDGGTSTSHVCAALPEDFGTPGYGLRRKAEIDSYFFLRLPAEADALLVAYDAGLHSSYSLRQYLWAHKEKDVERARRLLLHLPAASVHRILRYLVDNYWQRHLGWPDIFAWRGKEHLFVEVKLSRDKLSEEQRLWIEQSAALQLPFAILKIHKLPSSA